MPIGHGGGESLERAYQNTGWEAEITQDRADASAAIVPTDAPFCRPRPRCYGRRSAISASDRVRRARVSVTKRCQAMAGRHHPPMLAPTRRAGQEVRVGTRRRSRGTDSARGARGGRGRSSGFPHSSSSAGEEEGARREASWLRQSNRADDGGMRHHSPCPC
jgi:hypothetical protein